MSIIGKFFDHAGIFLAAVLTLCGFLLLFLPWNKALNLPEARPDQPKGVVYVDMSLSKPTPAPHH